MEQTVNMKMTKNPIVQNLIELLNQNQQMEAANDVFEMAAYIDVMEQKMDTVIQELADVRKQLMEMERRQERRAVRQVISETVDKLELQCQKVKQQLLEVKTEVKAKAAEIVAEAKQEGKKALNKVAEFLGIKYRLQSIRLNVQESVAELDKSITKIGVLGTGMREAMQKAANTIRSFTDKPEKEYGEKKFSKTELLKMPLQVKRKLLCTILDCADAAIGKVEKLSDDVKRYQGERADREVGRAGGEKLVEPAMLSNVAEQKHPYGAETFEARREEFVTNNEWECVSKNILVADGKKR